MSEKTAEEKLRQALEGSAPDSNNHEQPASRKKTRPLRARPKAQSRSARENLGERLDSFMDDFERRIEQSINAVKSPSESPKRKETSRRVKISAEPMPETLHKIPEKPKEIPATPEPEPEIPQEVAPSEPETLPEAVPSEAESEPELPDIPVIESVEVPHDEEGNLPDIPVIIADNEEDTDDSEEIFADGFDELSDDEGSENPGHEEETDETEKEAPIDFQEAELTEAPDVDDDFAEIDMDNDTFSDEPLDEEAGIPDDFSPPADVVLSVDDEIPQISAPAEESDPESESAPVTVTMPESTKTAEDKLMADIAEAMTGNPLSLDSQESPAYNLPENFFTDGMSSDSPQSAEDKLKANIVQALSESPIDTAQNQANQNLEEDISPFEELSIPETLTPAEEELPPEEPDDDAETLTEEPHDNEEIFTPEPDGITEDDSGTQNEDDDGLNDPFTIPDFGDDDDETESESVPEMNLSSAEDETKFFADAFTEESDETQEAESESEIEPEIMPESAAEIDTEPEEELQPEQQTSADNDEMPFPVEENVKDAPMTEQEALIAMLNQEFDTEDNTKEEAESENDMPEQSLLEDEMPETFEPEENNDNDDFDISSLGEELGQAAVIADDDSEDFSAVPSTVTEMITEPENFTATAGAAKGAKAAKNPEDDHKEKTMSIREKLASRKNGNTDASTAGKKSGGLLLTILTAALAVIGGLILWQLMTVSDKITSLAMNAPGYESSAGTEAPSYEYAIDFILDPNLSDRMAQRGRAGWQVVGSRRTQDSTTGQYGYEFIFMRRTPGR